MTRFALLDSELQLENVSDCFGSDSFPGTELGLVATDAGWLATNVTRNPAGDDFGVVLYFITPDGAPSFVRFHPSLAEEPRGILAPSHSGGALLVTSTGQGSSTPRARKSRPRRRFPQPGPSTCRLRRSVMATLWASR